MNQKQNEDLDSINDELLNLVKDNYSTCYYHMRVTQSKANLYISFCGKKRGRFPTVKINNLLNTSDLLLIKLIIAFVFSCVSCLTITFSTLMF